jgi:hypothetical protein
MTVARKIRTFLDKTLAAAAVESTIKVHDEVLRRLGWRYIIAKQTVSDEELLRLLSDLRTSNDAHAWRLFFPSPGLSVAEQLLEFENKRRPTVIYFYHAVNDKNQQEFIGTGAIASKINNDFPFSGFPVAARGFIFEKYRNNRLYTPLLIHRIEMCQKVWGSNLNGVHLGSANPRIFQSVKKSFFGLPVVYIGNEIQTYQNHQSKVRDYLWLGEEWRNRLVHTIGLLGQESSNDDVQQVRDLVMNLVENKFTATSFAKLNSAYEKASKNNLFPDLKNYPLHQLLSLLKAIPILEEFTEDLDQPLDINPRKAG